MEGAKLKQRIDGERFAVPRKIDGHMQVVFYVDGQVFMLNANGKQMAEKLKYLDAFSEAVKAAGLKQAVIAAELYLPRPEGRLVAAMCRLHWLMMLNATNSRWLLSTSSNSTRRRGMPSIMPTRITSSAHHPHSSPSTVHRHGRGTISTHPLNSPQAWGGHNRRPDYDLKARGGIRLHFSC